MSCLVALGDSITRGRGGAPALGVHPQSWAQWLAEAMVLPYLPLARDGATVADVVRDQLPALPGRAAVATLYVGANDARSLDFDGPAFEAGLREAATRCAAVADRLLMATLPVDLGRPRAGADVLEANAAIRRVAEAVRAVLVRFDDFGGPLHVLPDAVHPTSLGMVEMAERAALALGAPHRPSELADVRVTRRGLARYWPWYAKLTVRDAGRRTVERLRLASRR